MIWRVEVKETARKQIKKLDKNAQSKIVRFLRERVAETDDPERQEKHLRVTLVNYGAIASVTVA